MSALWKFTILVLSIVSTIGWAQQSPRPASSRYGRSFQSTPSDPPCKVSKGTQVEDTQVLDCYRYLQKSVVQPLQKALATIQNNLQTARSKGVSFARYYDEDHLSQLTSRQELENWYFRNVTRRMIPFPMSTPHQRVPVITENDRLYLDVVASIQAFQDAMYLNDTIVNALPNAIFNYGLLASTHPYELGRLIGCQNCYRWLDFATRNTNQTRSIYLQFIQAIHIDYADLLPLRHLNGFPIVRLKNFSNWVLHVGRWSKGPFEKEALVSTLDGPDSKVETHFSNPDDAVIVKDTLDDLVARFENFAPMVPFVPKIDTLKKDELKTVQTTVEGYRFFSLPKATVDAWSEFEGTSQFPSSFSRQARKLRTAIDERARQIQDQLKKKTDSLVKG